MAESDATENIQVQKLVTIREVAKLAGVSVATVSRVLNGSTKVDSLLAKRVQAASAQLQYQPSRAARILAGRASMLIGLLVTDMQNPFYLDLIRGVEAVLQQHGYLVIVCNTLENVQKEQQYLEILAAESVAGAIVVPTRSWNSGMEHLRKRNIPIVAVDRRVEDRSIDCVIIDNMAAAQEAVTHLINNGYRRIGVIGGPKGVPNADERVAGYRQALKNAGIPREAALEQRGALIDAETGFRLTTKLLNLSSPVEAIFTANNRLTVGALRAIYAQHKRIPDDIALVGFDEVFWTIPELVSITSVIQSAYELGSAAANRLIQRLQKQDTPRQEIILQHQLVIRESSHPRSTMLPSFKKTTKTRKKESEASIL
jgi:LacI family transcriptional regulator